MVNLLVVLTACFVFIPPLSSTAFRVVLGGVFALLLPGYVLVATVFPGDARQFDDRKKRGPAWEAIGPLERLVLSFGSSVALVTLVGLVLGQESSWVESVAGIPWGIQSTTVFTVLGSLTLLGLVPAAIRRRRYPAGKQLCVPFTKWARTLRETLLVSNSSLERVANILLVVAILAMVLAVGFGGESTSADGVTEFYLLSEDSNGELKLSGYPTNLTTGESERFVLGIGNEEGATREYTAVVLLQRTQANGSDGTLTVVEEVTVDRFQTTVGDGETNRLPHKVDPRGLTGENLRLVYLLYVDEPPADPTIENAYRELHLWVDSTEESNTATERPPAG